MSGGGYARFFGHHLAVDTGGSWQPFSATYCQSLHKISAFVFSVALWAAIVLAVVCKQLGCRCKASRTCGNLALVIAAVIFLRTTTDLPTSTVSEISSSLGQMAQPLLDAHEACIAALASLRAAGAAAQSCAAPLTQDISKLTARVADAARHIITRTGAEGANQAASGGRLSLASLLAKHGPVVSHLAHTSDRMRHLSCMVPAALVVGGILVVFCATLRGRSRHKHGCRHQQVLAVVGSGAAIVAGAAALAIDMGAAAGAADFCRRPGDSAIATLRMAPKLHLADSQLGVMSYWLTCGESHTQGASMRVTRDPFRRAVQRMADAASQLVSVGTCRGESHIRASLVRTNLASAVAHISTVQHSLGGQYSCTAQKARFAHILGLLCGPTAESARTQLEVQVCLHTVGTLVLILALGSFICSLGYEQHESGVIEQPGKSEGAGERGTFGWYKHGDGRTERVEILKQHSEAEGGGYTIFIASLGRERSTIAERIQFESAGANFNARGSASASASARQIAPVDGYAGEAAALISSAQHSSHSHVNCAHDSTCIAMY